MNNMNVATGVGIWAILRRENVELQTRIEHTLDEIASGRKARRDLHFGSMTAFFYKVSQEVEFTDRQYERNVRSNLRLGMIIESLESQASIISEIKHSILNAFSDKNALQHLAVSAKTDIAKLVQLANTSFDSKYLFNGTDSLNPAMVPFDSSDSGSPKSLYTSMMNEFFNFTGDNPIWPQVDTSLVEAFLEERHDEIMQNEMWDAWSNKLTLNSAEFSVDLDSRSRFPTIAEIEGLRIALGALVALSELNIQEMPESSKQLVLEYSIQSIGRAEEAYKNNLKNARLDQDLLTVANERLKQRTSTLSSMMNKFTSTDPVLLVSELNVLQVRMETTYALTSRIQGLFLARYI